MTLVELGDHAKNYEQTKQRRMAERSSERQTWYQKNITSNPVSKVYKSKMYNDVIVESNESKFLAEEKARKIQLKVDKIHSYSMLVREVHKPRVSQLKKDEMELLRLKGQRSLVRSQVNGRNPVQTDQNYRSSSQLMGRGTEGEDQSHGRKRKKINWTTRNPMAPIPVPQRRLVKNIDYLKELREQKNLHRDPNASVRTSIDELNPYYDWRPLKSSTKLGSREKAELIKEKTKMIE